MARLQRKDLAKEFEDVVKQEIKNHNEAVLESNMAINSLRDQILDFKEDCESKFASLGSVISDHSSKHVEMSDLVLRFTQSISKKINDILKMQKSDLEDVKKDILKRESYYLTINDFDVFRVKVDQWIAKITALFESQKDSFLQELSRCMITNLDACQNLETKIWNFLEDERSRFIKINMDLDRIALTFDGLKREIEISKKNLFSIEKNIENLYTQIERLKAGDQ